MGSGPRERPGNFCDGAVCSHTRSDSFILDPVWTPLAWGHNYKVFTRERVPEINWSRYPTGAWGSPLPALHEPLSTLRKELSWVYISVILHDNSFYLFPQGAETKSQTPWNKIERGRELFWGRDEEVEGRLGEFQVPCLVLFRSWELGFDSVSFWTPSLISRKMHNYCSFIIEV